MTIATITYQQLVTVVTDWVKANCSNIANFAGIESYFKSGWTTGKQRYAGNDTSPSCYTVTISGNIVSQVAATTVDSDMTTFLATNCGLSNLSQNIPDSEFLDFIKDMVVFCSTKVVNVASQYSSTRYICYDTGNTSYTNPFLINTSDAKKMLLASDITELLGNIITLVRQNMRNKTCQYTITLST